MARKLSFLLIGLVALMVAACGGGGTGGGGVSLTETYNADGVTFKYPSGWVVQAPSAPGGPVSLANNQAALDAAQVATTAQVTSGQQIVAVFPFTGETFAAMSAGISSPLQLLQQMGPAMSSADVGLTFGEPAETTIGGKPAARSSGSSDAGDGTLIAINMGDAGYVLVMGATGKGEMGNFEATLNALAESVSITAAS